MRHSAILPVDVTGPQTRGIESALACAYFMKIYHHWNSKHILWVFKYFSDRWDYLVSVLEDECFKYFTIRTICSTFLKCFQSGSRRLKWIWIFYIYEQRLWSWWYRIIVWYVIHYLQRKLMLPMWLWHIGRHQSGSHGSYTCTFFVFVFENWACIIAAPMKCR